MIHLTLFWIALKLSRLGAAEGSSICISPSMSIPRVRAKSFTTLFGTTPAISSISRGVICVGGVVDADSREADCRYVIDRRRSPLEVSMSVATTSEVTSTCSAAAICRSRDDVDDESRGVNLNFEQREASGSMMLDDAVSEMPEKHTEMH